MQHILWPLVAVSFFGLTQSQYVNFRQYCATPTIVGTSMSAPCQEYCSEPCSGFFYQSSMDLGNCLAYHPLGFLMPKKNGMFNESCSNCFNTWDEPDVIQCQCRGHSGQVHQPQFNLNDVVGTHCGRLTCFDFINQLGTPLNGHPDPPICDIHSDEPSGLKKVPEATPPPGLLYVRRGVVHRQQFPNNSVIETPVTVPAFFALTAPLAASKSTTHVIDTTSTTVLTVTGKPQVWKST